MATSRPDECGALRFDVVAARFDQAAKRVALDLVIEDEGDGMAVEPVFVAGWEDSLRVIAPPGLSNSKHTGSYLGLLGADSVVAGDANNWAGASLWFLSAAAPESGDSQRWGPRTIEMSVHSGVSGFTAVLWVSAELDVVLQVPDSPVDLIPAGILSNLDPEYGVPSDVLAVTFVPGLTPERKGEILAAVGGRAIIGGAPFPLLDGIYLVRVATGGDVSALLRAGETLNAQQEVISAALFTQLAPSWLPADEGQGGDWSRWSPRPEQANGANWAQQLVAAPLAWGCQTGSPDVAVAVVDQDFFGVRDLAPNVANVPASSDTTSHGTRVASILAAVGNNGMDMTGMMWNARLSLHDYAGSGQNATVTALQQVGAAIAGGAAVVSFSSSYYWHVLKGRKPNAASSADSSVVLDIYRQSRDHLAGLKRFLSAPFPLIVVPAGNDTVDAFWAAVPQLARDFPDHILVVGGTEHQPLRPDGTLDLASFSNHGSLVDIAAPAVDVYSLDRRGSVTPDDGTSFAVPFVTGTAGLLLSSDPRLDPGSLKGLITQGATRGGRSAVGAGGRYPLLNVHQALKIAARRQGGPICGNAVVVDGTRVLVDRGGTWEEIVQVASSKGFLTVRHGGRIDVFTEGAESSEAERISFTGGSWTVGPIPDTADLSAPAGFQRSQMGLSHDGLTRAVTRLSGTTAGTNTWDVVVTGPAGERIRQHTESLSGSSTEECVRLYQAIDQRTGEVILEYCERSNGIYNGETLTTSVAFHPLGEKVLLTVNRSLRTTALGSWIECGPDRYCRYATSTFRSRTSAVHELDLATGASRKIFETPHQVRALGVSEDGEEIMFLRSDWNETVGPWNQSIREDGCTVEVRDYETGGVRIVAPFERICLRIDPVPPEIEASPMFGHGS